MTSNPLKMDIENPLALKRSSSAPMINELNNIMASQTNAPSNRESSPSTKLFASSIAARPRRFSTSFSPLSGPSSPKLTPRVNQLRQEESVDITCREAAHERELHSAMIMSQSYEDLTIIAEPKCEVDGKVVNGKLMDQLHLNLPAYSTACSSPSPTRTGLPLKQCFSPSFLKTGLSPSPTRKFTTRRSQSPIAMRPSSLGPVKRKCDMEESDQPAKKVGLLIAQPKFDIRWSESDSSSSFDSVASPGAQTPVVQPSAAKPE